jgi:hypothetical protein
MYCHTLEYAFLLIMFFSLVVAAELGAGEASDHADLDASVEATECVCQEVRNLLVKVHSTLERVRGVSVPESTSTMMASIIEALALKEEGEDPMVATVHRQVTTGFESIFLMMMMHEVECDFKNTTGTYSKGKDGLDKSPKDYLERSRDLSNCLAHFLAEQNARRKAARE